ncbi:DUF1996 domain-containing protein [Actinomycetospora sp. NBRC 106375]|uniref:DUF1996 domain-containing protein n=1 Tax=Actinomycetospora sp. NBRC 106375 TaxID=3032207 RepID=UPI0025565621|nr:DUF1996 domain-containing protein [Actinomycetospora sp. NBRC 106375]
MAALLVTGGVAVAAGSAFADSDSGDSGGGSGLLSALSGDDSGSDSGGSGDNGSEGSGDDGSGDSGQGSDEDSSGGSGNRDGSDQGGQDENGDGQGDQGNGDDQAQGDDQGDGGDQGQNGDDQGDQGDDQGQAQAAAAEDPFPGRDQAAPAGADQYVDINDVDNNGGNIGDGGRFSGGQYTVDCGVSDHNNSDNYMAAPGKRNGAQHVHDYVGNDSTNANSDDDSLDAAGTSCGNDDKSTFFWPVLRDLNGQSPDEGEDGGSLDGNEGSILKPLAAQLTFHGHGDEAVQPMPTHLMMIMGNAKQGQQNGDNVNAKYTCTGHEDQVTDKYPICGAGSNLVRILDYPSCWDGQNLESKNFRDHMAFPNEEGNCENGFTPIPALRISLTYNQPDGRAFAIDSFPQEQHNPKTDHSDFENLASETGNRNGADCINNNQQCTNVAQQ